MLRFYAVAPWTLLKHEGAAGEQVEGELRPVLTNPAVLLNALERVEYRGFKSAEYAQQVLQALDRPAIFARSPKDLPALLRTSDQLRTLARQASGDRAQLFKCTCGTRYAVPLSMMRPLSIRCERCGATIEFDSTSGVDERARAETHQTELNACRESLAEFFREAMARGWPVLVEDVPAKKAAAT